MIDTEKKLAHACACGRSDTRNIVGRRWGDLKVDTERRRATRANHSATHLLHAALKRVLGGHVSQKGSLVDAERLRFDFSHPKPVSQEELERIELQVNEVIRQNADTSTRLLPTDQAIAAGAEALFGEKYGVEVRVLTMGEAVGGEDPDPKAYWSNLRARMCAACDIGICHPVRKRSRPVRRIEALTSEGARRYLTHQAELAREAAAALKTNAGDLPGRVAALSDERRRLERELADAKKALALAGPAKAGGDDGVKTIAGVKAVLRKVDGVAPKDLKGLADEAKAKLGSGVVAFVAAAEGKVSLVVGVTDDLTARISAVDLVRLGAEALGGKGGGGRPDMAQAGGPDTGNAGAALIAIEKRLSELAPA